MREPNFSIPATNKASVGITTALYDRRALDCTSTLPLINSLNHLAYLTTSSTRIREILTVDGGIERLVVILKDGRTRDPMSMWKWNLAFQCIVNIGVRGSENVRTRVVEADMVPVIATILDNYIQVMDRANRRNPAAAAASRARQSRSSSFGVRRPAAPPSIDIPLPNAQADIAQRYRSQLAHHALHHPLHQHQQQLQQLQHQQLHNQHQHHQQLHHRQHHHHHHNRMAATGQQQQPLPISTTSATSAATGATSATTASQTGVDLTLQPVRDVDRLPSMLPPQAGAASSSSLPTSPATPGAPPPAARAAGSYHDPRDGVDIQQRLSPAVVTILVAAPPPPPPPPRRPVVRNNTDTDTDDDQNPHPHPPDDHDDHDDHEPDDHHHTHHHHHHHRLLSEEDEDPTADELGNSAPPRPQNESIRGPMLAAVDGPEAQEQQDMAFRGFVEGGHIALAAPANPIIGFFPSPQPVNATLGITRPLPSVPAPRQTMDGAPVPSAMPREEDVLMSLQLLAYVSKYCNLRPYFQKSHIVPRLSIERELQLLDRKEAAAAAAAAAAAPSMAGGGPPPPPPLLLQPAKRRVETDDEEYLLPDDFNIFPLVEKFTVRHHPQDLQYWAGVVMRNLCRKDETNGGIRQCAYYECGKWEEYTRQFAKCRRCRRTKYCSKDCQKSAWVYHRHWCIAAPPQS